MKKNEFTVIVTEKETGKPVSETVTKSQNKMWTACRETLRADEQMKLKVDVVKDGELFKSFTRVVRAGKRQWWMHNAVKATNKKWMLKMQREAEKQAQQKVAIQIPAPVAAQADAAAPTAAAAAQEN